MKNNLNTIFFLVVLVGLTVLAFFILKPFLIPFLFALILVHFFNPVYKFFLKKTGRKRLSSLLTCLLVALIIIIPVLVISILLVGEVQSMIVSLATNPAPLQKMINFIPNLSSHYPVLKSLGLEKIFNPDSALSALKSFSQVFLFVLQGTYAGILHIIFVMFIMFFSLFYMFIDGEKLVAKMMKLVPLSEKYDNILLDDLNSMIRATIRGTTLMAIFEGIIGSLLFWAAGVASPILFGILMAVFSVIPPLGSGIVWIPVGIAMMLFGHTAGGIVILLIGFLVIGSMDNFLRPKLIGKDIQLHTLLVLFSTLGGIIFFGISGFIIGPLVMTIFVALWDIYALEFKAQPD